MLGDFRRLEGTDHGAGHRQAAGWRAALNGLRVVLITLTGQAAALLVVSYLGDALPIGDSVAVFRLQLALLVAFGGILIWLVRGRLPALLALGAGSFAAAPILAGFAGWGVGAPGDYTLYQKNLYKKELSRTLLTREILTLDPDFVTLQEITAHDLRYMRRLFDAYENRLMCTEATVVKVGLLSRFPLVPGSETCREEERLAAAQVRMPDGTTPWLVSVHLGWPYPAGQHTEAEAIAAWLRTLDGPVMVGGDFNMVPWGSSVRMIASAARAERAGPYFGTFPNSGPLLPLPIDHILLPRDASARAEARPKVGSDHLGIVARFSF